MLEYIFGEENHIPSSIFLINGKIEIISNIILLPSDSPRAFYVVFERLSYLTLSKCKTVY
jgi:hypothetical protein